MARKKITANLNGGDAITAMGDLEFQIYDSLDDSIIATANYAAIGSVNTNGTDGGNINYTLNETYDPGSGLLGQIILDGVDLGSTVPENVKIRCKDESGNESTLSASFSTTKILFEDDFASTVVTEAQFTKVNPNAAEILSQGGGVYKLGDANGTGSDDVADYIIADTGRIITDDLVLTYDLITTGDSYIKWQVGLTTSGGSDVKFFFLEAIAGQLRTQLKVGGVNEINSDHAIDPTTQRTVKIAYINGVVIMSYWNGSSWTVLETSTIPLTGTWYPVLYARRQERTGSVNIDNLYLTNRDFTGQYPT